MTRIDFHVLPDSAARGRERYACRLCAKVWAQGRHVYLYADDAAAAALVDDLLWAYRDTAFLPHRRLDDPVHGGERVLVGYGQQVPDAHDVLVNLAVQVPLFFSHFDRVVEIVAPQPDARSAARARWRFYNERGYPLNKHDIRNADD